MESVSNLAMLKLFYDAGVDVTEFPFKSFMTSVHYPQGENMDIFIHGLKSLFSVVEFYSSYEEEIPVEYKPNSDLVENLIVIRDKNIKAMLNCEGNQLRENILDIFKTTETYGIVALLDDGFTLDIDYPILLHQVLKNLLEPLGLLHQFGEK